jgi:hypothetical protein
MRKPKGSGLDFIIDKLTNSIENVITGDSFSTDVTVATDSDIRIISKQRGWAFDWKSEHKFPTRTIYKLTIVNNATIIQGLVSLEVLSDHVFMHLIESAPFNKGKGKVYLGVPGNLVAFACRLSFQNGHDGYVCFISKTNLISHYIETLGAEHIGAHSMVIDTKAAVLLINKYFRRK